tara:strand:- start:4411 stop:4542 length:132 start_codon:yes stop_codon:yes gene_type:complete
LVAHDKNIEKENKKKRIVVTSVGFVKIFTFLYLKEIVVENRYT